MGGRLTRLKPRSGFCAETGAAARVLLSTYLGTPVSTTHAIAGAIAGVGSIQRMKAVRWGIATNIVWAWVLTIPAAAMIAWLSYFAAALRHRQMREVTVVSLLHHPFGGQCPGAVEFGARPADNGRRQSPRCRG